MITNKGRGHMHQAVTAAEILEGLPPVLLLEEACKALRVSPRQLRRWIALGKLQTLDLSERPIRIPRKAVEALLTQAMAAPVSRARG